jgi:hypothetical protein
MEAVCSSETFKPTSPHGVIIQNTDIDNFFDVSFREDKFEQAFCNVQVSASSVFTMNYLRHFQKYFGKSCDMWRVS